jgi:uncharacterized membrane protein YsdA (DUF1294 family)
MFAPYRFHFILAMILCVAAAVGLWWLLGGTYTWPAGLASWLVAVNVVTFGYYGYDKARAAAARTRVPELVLHGLAALGGSPAALCAMSLFRHKTIKGSFRILFWCIVVVQVLLIACIIKLVWWS